MVQMGSRVVQSLQLRDAPVAFLHPLPQLCSAPGSSDLELMKAGAEETSPFHESQARLKGCDEGNTDAPTGCTAKPCFPKTEITAGSCYKLCTRRPFLPTSKPWQGGATMQVQLCVLPET